MRRAPSPLLALAVLAAMAGCAAPGPYPSLAVRPAERALAEGDEERQPAALPEDPAVAATISRLSAEARRGATEFDAARGAAETAVTRAAGAGSDSWVEAQQAVSRLEAARATTTRALAELDAAAVEQARAGGLAEADLERIRAAIDQLQAIANGQTDVIRRLGARLSPR